jgi:hypothetical protein
MSHDKSKPFFFFGFVCLCLKNMILHDVHHMFHAESCPFSSLTEMSSGNLNFATSRVTIVTNFTLFLPIAVNHSIEIRQTIWENWN